ncbi:Formyltetrahydrofolate deformylase [Ceraceosorus guamensis]|uniref:Formyltetrahydrofolate deformylase n=1 Tax=Ceraceosorus guamensis TaxID=1522189 RepID=A0A316W022_9BASI|nr:Formyltetrahydrofolate deformylase [Ceraceosorus guamensis]PWN43082.1 Formyltetrahydrofolate deformylase [Ceraceosorus guamensis]
MALCLRSLAIRVASHSRPSHSIRSAARHSQILNDCSSARLGTQRRGLRSIADLEDLTKTKDTQGKPIKTHIEEQDVIMSAPISSAPPAVPDQPDASASSGALPAASAPPSIILTLSCPDGQGIVHNVSGWLASRGLNIRDSAQYGDPVTSTFFMRVHAEAFKGANKGAGLTVDRLKEEFQRDMASELGMQFEVREDTYKPRTLIMVSKIGHCLNDLLFRVSSGTLPIAVPLIISNHNDYAPLAKAHNIPFYHLPISVKEGKTKEMQEAEILRLAEEYKIDLVVLARYMQILSPKLCDIMSGRIINIHHSFLPAFVGAKPYHQAHARGVKLIGATSHVVTRDLDEGPIIEQDVERVTHADSPADLVRIGADIEARVLARAVRWFAEHRVLLNGNKTVVL